MDNSQTMFNQVNAVISLFTEDTRNKLPEKLVDFFSKKANCPPEEALDITKPLAEQDLADATLLMLYQINKLIKESK